MQKPLGPRKYVARSASPLPPLQDTSPLNIRKDSSNTSTQASGGRSSTPSLSLNIPGNMRNSPQSRPSMKLAIPAVNGIGSDGYNYYAPGAGVTTSTAEHSDTPTIRPGDPTSSLATQVPTKKPFDSVREMLSEIKQIQNSLTESRPTPPSNTIGSDSGLTAGATSVSWSDDVFEELSRLGEGAGGAVHKVKDKRNGKIMARKTITTREAPMVQLLRELAMISSTQHTNIILFFGAYMSPSSSEVKILMEVCEGGSLEAVSKRIRERGAMVGEKIAGRLAEGILQGLAYLHTKKTIHRDIKPSNVLLSQKGVVKLCDFGVSGELVNSMANTFTGTSFYMAPERICGHEYTIRSDVWSTGISLLELVTNRFPYPNDLPPIELMMYITTGEPPRLEDEPGIHRSVDMKDFIKQCLIVDAHTRPTPKDMISHPWIVHVMKQEVHMDRWIAEVWGWNEPSRRSRDESRSRLSTGSFDGRSTRGTANASPELV